MEVWQETSVSPSGMGVVTYLESENMESAVIEDEWWWAWNEIITLMEEYDNLDALEEWAANRDDVTIEVH